MIKFTVYGVPQPAGSKRAFIIRRKDGSQHTNVTDANPKAASWKTLVADAARRAYSGPLLRSMLTVGMTFYFPRPKAHYGTGRNAGRVKTNAPIHKATKPDVLKLARGTEDALTGIVWADDAQTISLAAKKTYGEPARAEVSILAWED